MSEKPEIGDKVRVTYEGVVSYSESRSFGFGTLLFSRSVMPNRTVEIIEKRKPKVGEVISGVDAYAGLPVGSVVGSQWQTLFRTSKGWASAGGQVYSQHPDAPRKLLYLPES